MEDSINKTILIVDDEQAVINALSSRFATEGFKVIIAHNGEEGLSLAIKERPHIILLDIVMPKKDGMVMLKELRQDPWGKNVPVIILTNLDSDSHAVEAFKYQAYDFVVKSNYKIQEVVTLVKEKLGL